MSNEIVIKLKDNRIRMVERMQLLQDVASAIALVPAGLARLHSADHFEFSFALMEIAAVGVLGFMTMRELRNHDDITPGINWVNMVVGVILLMESALRTHEGHKYFSPTLLTGITSIVLATVQGRLRERKQKKNERSVRISDERIMVRPSKFRAFEHAWIDIASIQEKEHALVITPRHGKARTINLKRYDNRDEVRGAIMDAAVEHRVQVLRIG